jgi:uncharacterized protein YecT (DUF1311 family)
MLRRLLIILIILFLSNPVFSQTQSEMNQDAYKAYEASDKKLNEVYQKILKLYSENELFIKNLKTAQRLWIQLRDAQLSMMYPERDNGYYGSVLPLCEAIYLKKLTDVRIKELEQWLADREDGELCSGTIGEFKVIKIE